MVLLCDLVVSKAPEDSAEPRTGCCSGRVGPVALPTTSLGPKVLVPSQGPTGLASPAQPPSSTARTAFLSPTCCRDIPLGASLSPAPEQVPAPRADPLLTRPQQACRRASPVPCAQTQCACWCQSFALAGAGVTTQKGRIFLESHRHDAGKGALYPLELPPKRR